MNKLPKAGLISAAIFLHFLAGGLIYYFWQPIVSWYWNYRPILGVDFYNTVSYVGYLARHFSFRPGGWWPNWWGGFPMAIDSYPTLHFYLILPLLKFFSLPQAVQAYMLGTGFLFLFFSYLLFWEIGKDRVLAVVLTIASAFSLTLYGPLVWGGSLPYFATQFFLPLVLWLLVRFFSTRDKRWYYLSALFLGLSFLGHLQVGFSFIVPLAFLFLFFYVFEEEKFFSAVRLKRLFSYFLVAIIVGYTQLGVSLGFTPLDILVNIPRALSPILGKLLSGQEKVLTVSGAVSLTAVNTGLEIAQYQKDQFWYFLTKTNTAFFIFLIGAIFIFLLTVILRKKKMKSFGVIIFAIPTLWIIFYNALLAYGISIFHGGWYRVFWPFPLALGILISFVWGDFWLAIKERFEILGKKWVLNFTLMVIAGIMMVIPGFFLLSENSAKKMLQSIEIPRLRQQSSAFPDSLNVYINNLEFSSLRGRLIPSWLNPNETQYRLYEADQRVNIWWGSLFDMPLVKGYIDPPPGDSSGGFYWTSIALSQFEGKDTLVETWGVPEEMAYNNALFLLDWYSIKYVEAEHEKSDSYNPPASYLIKSDIYTKKEKVTIPGWAQLYVGKADEPNPIVWHPNEEEHLTYYEVKNDLISPITHSTNASRIGVIGALDAYRTILRDLAATNLNSRMVIPLQLGQFIDDVSYETLKEMDAVILYAYDYKNHNKSWEKLEKYVKAGGRVFIETGSEVKQTNSINLPSKYPKELPAIFPLKMTKQEEMGEEWQLSGESKEIEGISLGDFGPPILDDKPWRFSLPNSSGDLKEGAKIILANKDIPLIVSYKYGQGEVIWSGMNLPYHLTTHKNMEEAKLFKNLMADLVTLNQVEYGDYSVERKSAQKVVIRGNKAKGVFFREQNYSGWSAKINSDKISGGLKIFRAGPTFPGFMYVIIPEKARTSDFRVSFSFHGNPWIYFWQITSLVTILAILDRAILNSRLVVPILLKIYNPLRKRVGKWWEKEDEY